MKTQTLKENFRNSRQVIDRTVKEKERELTLFLGLFNAEKYIDGLLQQLLSQTDSDFNLVVVDNRSTDSTWSRLEIWSDHFNGRIKLVRNPVNVDYYGSIHFNSDLIESKWTALMGQDDTYLPRHVSVLKELAVNANENISIISSGLGSISEAGRKLPSSPRALWLLSVPASQPYLLSCAIRQHLFPDPSSAYRTDIIRRVSFPWHSMAFPDNELLLNALTLGSAVWDSEETVLYAELDSSASHNLTKEARENGAGLSLIRFFNGENFRTFVQNMATGSRADFAIEATGALQGRFGVSPLERFVKYSLLEVLAEEWEYEEPQTLRMLAQTYSEDHMSRAVSALENIGALHHGTNLSLNTDPAHTQGKSRSSWVIKETYNIVFKFLPKGLARFVMRSLLKRLGKLNRFKNWDFGDNF